MVVTGFGAASPIGSSRERILAALQDGSGGVRRLEAFEAFADMGTRLGAPVLDAELRFPRKVARNLGRLGELALFATEQALADAGLGADALREGSVGLAYGSTHGSSSALIEFVAPLLESSRLSGLSPRSYLKFMSNTCAATLAAHLGIRGRVLSTCSACTSSSQAIGLAYEAIRHGQQEVMLCGGAEELHPVPAAIFDLLMATSTHYNDAPEQAPRPFDAERDGLVIGEGAATLVLERRDRALARGARPLAEVIGFATNCDGDHLTSPAADGMRRVIELALTSAGLDARDIDYVNAHATATEVGDLAEATATHAVLGAEVAISSTKGQTGHTLGACGALEAIFCILMMQHGFIAPTRNLHTLDTRLAPLDYVRDSVRRCALDTVMTNNFAFGGVNTALILRRC